jgi:hypothetical protein
MVADPKVKERFADLGLEVASREQQSAEGLAAFRSSGPPTSRSNNQVR